LEAYTVKSTTPAQRASQTAGKGLQPVQAKPLAEVRVMEKDRMSTGDSELDRVLGNGVVPGAVVLLGGEPGIGKSTLMLQSVLAMAKTAERILYVAGEESPEQVRMRAERLGDVSPSLFVFPETDAQAVLRELEANRPSVVIIDSIQTMFLPEVDSAPGSVSQIRETSGAFTRFAKQHHVPVFFIGHITKEGSLAGPKVLEHMVDVVLQFEGERHHAYRMLRAAKNRFGTTAELGLYEMRGSGLIAVEHPSNALLGQSKDEDALSGTAIAAAIEGARPMLVEVQALVSSAVYGTPQRSGTGFDLRRLNMLLAVLEKRCGFKLGTQDVFLNMAGGLRIQDPALDLAVVAAILSSVLDVPLPYGTVFAGEVGLTGEIRPVPRMNQRMAEASRLGMKRMFYSGHARNLEAPKSGSMELIGIRQVSDLHGKLF
jgi:DNA repair protein RadA/Sms|tara:strand:+ start:8654 stop:9940 length:1287 start_codon:yes stop_codon:yes gene_type:complete